jgi:maltose alpha-D-glucosyltransferase / alpha-amylase
MPRFHAALYWADTSLALASEFLSNPGDAWSLALKEFARYVDDPAALDDWLPVSRRIGQRTGEMHYALAHAPSDFREFAPEPLTAEDVGAILMSMLETARTAAEALSQDSIAASREAIAMLPRLLAALDGMRPIQALIERIQQQPPEGTKIRIHGDYHLGQVIHTGDDFLIMDFGGESLRSVPERRTKQPAARDVAGMLRSFHYAAFAARGNAAPETAEAWAQDSQDAFLAGWRSALADSPVANESLLPVFLLQKAFYELSYELSHRPDWAHIPMRGILTLARALR